MYAIGFGPIVAGLRDWWTRRRARLRAERAREWPEAGHVWLRPGGRLEVIGVRSGREPRIDALIVTGDASERRPISFHELRRLTRGAWLEVTRD